MYETNPHKSPDRKSVNKVYPDEITTWPKKIIAIQEGEGFLLGSSNNSPVGTVPSPNPPDRE
jgi:hypothetical protein